jgi:hypothetical protein
MVAMPRSVAQQAWVALRERAVLVVRLVMPGLQRPLATAVMVGLLLRVVQAETVALAMAAVLAVMVVWVARCRPLWPTPPGVRVATAVSAAACKVKVVKAAPVAQRASLEVI